MPRSTSIEWMRTHRPRAQRATLPQEWPQSVREPSWTARAYYAPAEPATLFFAGPGLILMAYSL